MERIVVLGSTLTALALARHCRALSLPCVLVHRTPGPAVDSRIPEIVNLSGDSDEQMLDRITALARQAPSALVADSDGWLRWLARHRSALDDAFVSVLHPTNAILALCLDKTRFLHWCREQDFPAPRVYRSDQDPDTLTFPVLVRPQETRHGRSDRLPKAIEIEDQDALAALLERYREVGAEPNICESLLRPQIRQYSVGLARNSDGRTTIMVCEKVRPAAEMCGGGTYVVARPDADVEALAERVVNRLGYFGIAEVEILKDLASGEMFLIEINARPWVQYSLTWRSGFDFLTFLLEPAAYDVGRERPVGASWISFTDDLYVVFSRSEGMRARGRITIGDYVSSLLGTRVFAVWSWRDPLPAVKSWFRTLRAAAGGTK